MMVSVNPDKKDAMLLTVQLESGELYSDMDMPDMPFGVANFVQFWSYDRTMLLYIPLSDVKYMHITCVPMVPKEAQPVKAKIITLTITSCVDCPYNTIRYESTGRAIGKMCRHKENYYDCSIKLDSWKTEDGMHDKCPLVRQIQ